jgi:hypothetical protein
MNNTDMKAGRYLKRQTGKRMFFGITNHLQAGGSVLICTYTRATKLQAKHIDMITLGKSGSVYIQAGKRRDCIDFCGIKYIRA